MYDRRYWLTDKNKRRPIVGADHPQCATAQRLSLLDEIVETNSAQSDARSRATRSHLNPCMRVVVDEAAQLANVSFLNPIQTISKFILKRSDVPIDTGRFCEEGHFGRHHSSFVVLIWSTQ